MRSYSAFNSSLCTSSARSKRLFGSVVKGFEGIPRISLVESPESLMIPTRPAKVSPTFFIITKDWEPVSQKSPLRPERSTAILI